MKKVYFAVVLVFLVLLAFSACSPSSDDVDSSGKSSGSKYSSKGGNSSNGGSNQSSSSKGGGNSSAGGAGSGVCYAPDLMENEEGEDVPELPACFEGKTASATPADCREVAEDMEATVNYRTSCPAGHKLKCDADEFGLYVYLYGDAITDNDITCYDFDWEPAYAYGACYSKSLEEDFDYAECIEPITDADCAAIASYNEDYYEVDFGTSCPSEYKCKIEDGEGTSYYYYGADADDSCDFNGDEEGSLVKAKKLLKAKSLPKKGLLKGFKAKGFSKK